MGIGEARAAKVRHRVRLAPDDVVEDPEVGVLEQRSNAVDVVISTDHPDGAVVLEDAPRLGEPRPGAFVIGREAVELVPIVVHCVHAPALWTYQVPSELQIV